MKILQELAKGAAQVIFDIFLAYKQTWIVAALDALSVFLYRKIYNPKPIELIIFSLIAIIVLLLFYIVYSEIRSSHFSWGYIYSLQEETFTLDKDKATWTDCFKIKPKNNLFTYHISGYYDWDSSVITSVTLNCNNGLISLFDQSKKERIGEKQNNCLKIDSSPTRAFYDISLNSDWDKKDPISIDIDMNYDKKTFDRNIYLDILRPTKKVKIKLVVKKDCNISNVRFHKFKLYGEKDSAEDSSERTEYLSTTGKLLKSKSNENNEERKVYELTIRNPKLFYRYQICWEWFDCN